MRTISARLAYLLAFTVFVFGGLEILLRLVFSDPDYHWPYRFLAVSPNAYQNLDSGIWIHTPNTPIREVGVYAMAKLLPPGPRIEMEYDCRMRANNLGLLQDDDIPPGTRVTLIVGDSFTAGQGGCPWFGRLQARRPNERLANGGQIATGFSHWQRLIEHLRKQGLVIDRLLAIAISDDFQRPIWFWIPEWLNCMNQEICQTNAFWQSVGLETPQADILKRVAERFEVRYPGLTAADFVTIYFKQNSYAYKFILKAIETVRGLSGGAQAANLAHPETEAALTMMKSLGVPFHVLIVPQRSEAGILGMARMTRAAMNLLDSHGITHSWCDLSGGDFLPNDGHPNRAGYDKLVACVDAILPRGN